MAKKKQSNKSKGNIGFGTSLIIGFFLSVIYNMVGLVVEHNYGTNIIFFNPTNPLQSTFLLMLAISAIILYFNIRGKK